MSSGKIILGIILILVAIWMFIWMPTESLWLKYLGGAIVAIIGIVLLATGKKKS